jgi:hypothetical protein
MAKPNGFKDKATFDEEKLYLAAKKLITSFKKNEGFFWESHKLHLPQWNLPLELEYKEIRQRLNLP